MNSDSTEATDCENYMFSVTAASDVHTAIMSSCDTAQEAALFKGLELVYATEDSTGTFHSNKTGYFWFVCELPELKHLLKTGQYTGEAANFGNWSIWTDALSAVNHWLMRYEFGTDDWKTRKETEAHCLVGFKLDCTRLCNDLICKELGLFNRLYWAHCLTGKNMLTLSDTEKHCITAFDLKKSPAAFLQETQHWVRHCQLSWDRTGNKPTWVNCENTAAWSTGLCDDTASPTSTAKMMPHWLMRGITAMKEALLGNSTASMD
jgi:hypothetical protein